VILAVAGADTVLFAISTLVGVAGALGVAYTVFRSASEQRLREVDQSLLNHQNLLVAQLESELSKCRTDLATTEQKAEMYRSDLTQRAAVDHLADLVVREEQTRRFEHEAQTMLLKDMITQLKGLRGRKEPGAIG
jgi:hypothetical protein